MTPWSVSPSAGWPNSVARAARPSILQAPSSSEYSEWTWRWAHPGAVTDHPGYAFGQTEPPGRSRSVRRPVACITGRWDARAAVNTGVATVVASVLASSATAGRPSVSGSCTAFAGSPGDPLHRRRRAPIAPTGRPCLRRHEHRATRGLAGLYSYTYGLKHSEVRRAAELRAEAMDVSDRLGGGRLRPADPPPAEERALLIAPSPRSWWRCTGRPRAGP